MVAVSLKRIFSEEQCALFHPLSFPQRNTIVYFIGFHPDLLCTCRSRFICHSKCLLPVPAVLCKLGKKYLPLLEGETLEGTGYLEARFSLALCGGRLCLGPAEGSLDPDRNSAPPLRISLNRASKRTRWPVSSVHRLHSKSISLFMIFCADLI